MDPLLELRAVSAGYGGRPVLFDQTWRLEAGEMAALVGPNGAGKSTLLALISRVHPPAAGELLLDGRPLASLGRGELARAVAVVPQQPQLPPGYTVDEVVGMGRAPHVGFFRGPRTVDQEAVEEAMARCEVTGLRHRRVETLSGGEAQRTVLARALAQQPRLLLLDEPTSHLDLRYQVEALRLARRAAAEGVAVLAVLHDLNLAARACDRVLLLADGRLLADGPPAEVLVEDRLRRAYRAEVQVRLLDGLPTVTPTRIS